VTSENPRGGWRLALLVLLATALCAGNLFLHKPISDACDWARARWGFPRYDLAALIGIPLISSVLVLPRLIRRDGPLRRPLGGVVLVVLVVITVASQRWLLVANIELIHFPQFGLLAVVLLAAGFSGEAAWLLATFAGVLDETYQHLVIYAGRADTYLDFNDMLLNAIGAAWGVVLFGSTARAPRAAPGLRWLRWPAVLSWLVGLLLLALFWDPPWSRPLLSSSAGGRLYRVLSPAEALAGCMLLWGLVALVERQNSKVQIQKSKLLNSCSYQFCILTFAFCILPFLAACSFEHARQGASQAPQTPFIITFWCGPPLAELDDDRAAEIAAAGFDVVGPPCEGPRNPALNRRALDVAARHGLRLWVADHRYHPYVLRHQDWRARIAAAVADYRHHPGLGGYFVVDEPSAAMFADVALVVGALHAEDATHPAYVNLLPDYIPAKGLEAESYEAYVDGFIAAVRPRLLSYDYYTFRNDGDRPTFFSNLALVRQRALAHRIPFMLIVLAMPHLNYRDPTEAELGWQIFHALAYGARGISYFAYWTPAPGDPQQFRYGLIEGGRPTRHYFRAMRLNQEVRALGDALSGFRSVTVADSLGEVAAPLPVGPLNAIEGGAVTAGFFADDRGSLAVLVVNRDYQYGATARLQLNPGVALPQVFDPQQRRWNRLERPAVPLAPGHGRLLRWKNQRGVTGNQTVTANQ
jgi:hypothetical protein